MKDLKKYEKKYAAAAVESGEYGDDVKRLIEHIHKAEAEVAFLNQCMAESSARGTDMTPKEIAEAKARHEMRSFSSRR